MFEKRDDECDVNNGSDVDGGAWGGCAARDHCVRPIRICDNDCWGARGLRLAFLLAQSTRQGAVLQGLGSLKKDKRSLHTFV
ncbi:hypothetical protein AVEN_184105-1 [Araneus ventricosus]|uniref:Uncharacterized protein n=1 Tax=Araneus ventricosus TaxID=182803 RepID=A0A4Y2CZV7_ARAVE|nr:hypothetical protein AVEN_184105-1 [Araneus ventricosus]